LWLFYNCLSDKGSGKFKPLIEKYAFFDNLDKVTLPKAEHAKFYDPKAFDSDLLNMR